MLVERQTEVNSIRESNINLLHDVYGRSYQAKRFLLLRTILSCRTFIAIAPAFTALPGFKQYRQCGS